MADPQITAAFYLSPSLDQWWRWDDNAQVLTWHEGQTIAFTAEVEAVINRLAPKGLPPFAALTLLLAACHDDWLTSPGRQMTSRLCEQATAANTPQERRRSGAAGRLSNSRVPTNFKPLLDGLDAVAALPKPLRSTVAAKAMLAEVVFETSQRGTPEDATLVAQALQMGLVAHLLRPRLADAQEPNGFARIVSEMCAGLTRINAEAMSLRLQTGLDQPVTAAEDDLSPPEKVRQLLAELRGDAELSALAKLAHNLMAAVTVPRTLRLREELQLGGVADLTNRGPLDRLLVSELAQDDLTLAVRVAVNEAMYLRRESPPKEPPHHRAILIDAGVRMWGVPRIFATAVALALSAMADPAASLKVFRASGADAIPVDLTSRQGLVAHLSALEAPAHPGAALPAFVAVAAAETPESDDAAGDAFVLTHVDAAADPEFLASVASLGLPSIYVGAVDRDGSFKLVARTRNGEKLVRQARLSLNEVLAPPRPKMPPAPLINEDERREEIPAIFRAKPFPLLLPHAVDPMRAMASPHHGLVAVTDDGRLLHWRDRHHGARQLFDAVPRGQLRMLSIDDEQEQVYALMIRGREMTAKLVVSDFACDSAIVPIELRSPSPVDAFTRGAFLFLVYRGRVDAYIARSGDHVASIELPQDARWHRGRFFQIKSGFAVVAYDGSSTLKLEKLPTPPATAAVFERAAHGGYWFIAPGRIGDHQMEHVYSLPSHLSPHQLRNVSPDGNLLEFSSAGPLIGKTYVVDLDKGGTVRDSRSLNWPALRLNASINLASPVQLRKKFTSIGWSGQNKIVLLHRGRNTSRGLTRSGESLCFETVPSGQELLAVRDFEPYRCKSLRIKQQLASWPDGSRAWLDSRGLLHLRSSDAAIPEITIVLRDDLPFVSAPAAWSSERKLTGPAYFIGEVPPADPEYFLDILRRFAMRLRG